MSCPTSKRRQKKVAQIADLQGKLEELRNVVTPGPLVYHVAEHSLAHTTPPAIPSSSTVLYVKQTDIAPDLRFTRMSLMLWISWTKSPLCLCDFEEGQSLAPFEPPIMKLQRDGKKTSYAHHSDRSCCINALRQLPTGSLRL